MKLLILCLVPVLIFWIIEEKFGTLWGLVAAMVWAVGECAYSLIRYKKIDNLTLISTALVLILGGMSWWLDNSLFFKFQPVIIEIIFVGILWWFGRDGTPALLKMGEQARPELFSRLTPEQREMQSGIFRTISKRLIVLLWIHIIAMAIAAVYGTTGQWAFAKGIGFNLLLGLWLVSEYVLIKKYADRNRGPKL